MAFVFIWMIFLSKMLMIFHLFKFVLLKHYLSCVCFLLFQRIFESCSITMILMHHSPMTSSNGTIYTLLALCAGHSPVTGKFPSQSPVTHSFDAFFDLRRNKRLSKQSRRWWFETSPCSLRRHCNALEYVLTQYNKPTLNPRLVGRQIAKYDTSGIIS